jgi:thioester reductase-like protein
LPDVAHALITGFPGFIGRRLVDKLLTDSKGLSITAIVEPRMATTAASVATPYGDRVRIVPGDIGERRLGLGDADWDKLRKSVDTVYHLAAIYNLAVPLEIAQRVNVDGTGNVLEFCEACKALDRHVYVSTAYVAGLRTGVVYEHELVMGQGFKNHYESTKFQAEVWVRERMDRVPTTILRPAVVVGDSRTGETEKFDGPYYMLRAIAKAERLHRPIVQFGSPRAAFNVVPVDYIVNALATVAADKAMAGETLQLVDPAPLSAAELLETLSNEYAGRPPQGKIPPGMLAQALRSKKMVELFDGTPRESLAYLNHPVRFDTRRTVDLLGPHGLAPPSFPEYASAMVQFFRANEDDASYVPPPAA